MLSHSASVRLIGCVRYEEKDFRSIHSDTDLWTWMGNVLPEAMFAPAVYGNASALVLKDNLVAGGTVRIRQLRSKKNVQCAVTLLGDAHKWIDFCYPL